MKEIDQIRKAADIVEIVRENTKLKKRGNKLTGDCPFCKSKNQFTVDKEKQLFHCFGCGEGGDIFTFVMKKFKMNFPKTLVLLTEKYGKQVAINILETEKIRYECLSDNVRNYQVELKELFDFWLKNEIKDKEFIFKMNEFIEKFAYISTSHKEENRIPF